MSIKRQTTSKQKAFTLIELLVVIAIIGILATLAIVSLQQARVNARDAKRLADIRQIQTALDLYYNDNNRYPAEDEFVLGNPLTSSSTGRVIMNTIPSAPNVVDGNCEEGDYTYTTDEEGLSYQLSFCLGKEVNDIPAGELVAFEGGIKEKPDACNDETEFTDPRDDTTYDIVAIGDQCWMAENLNIGERVNVSSNQTNNSIIEKYCYSDNESNCDIYGGLYQWNEMMQYVTTESTQGICPDGWYLPSDDDYKQLEMFLGMSQSDADDVNYRGIDQGSQLAGNYGLWNDGTLRNDSNFAASGFAALPAGYRCTSCVGLDLGSYARFWSSSEDGSNAWSRLLYSSYTFISRYSYSFTFGFSVRCLQN